MSFQYNHLFSVQIDEIKPLNKNSHFFKYDRRKSSIDFFYIEKKYNCHFFKGGGACLH